MNKKFWPFILLALWGAFLAACAAPSAAPMNQTNEQTLITVFRPPT